MKRPLLIFFLLYFISVVSAFGQEVNPLQSEVKADFNKATFADIIENVCTQATLDYAYNGKLKFLEQTYSLHRSSMTLKDLLDDLKEHFPFEYEVKNDVLYILGKSLNEQQFNQRKLQGRIIDLNTGSPLQGVVITDRQHGQLAVSDAQGLFSIHVSKPDYLFKLSFEKEGYKDQSLRLLLKEDKNITVRIEKYQERVENLKPIQLKPSGLMSHVALDLDDKNVNRWQEALLPKHAFLDSIVPEVQEKRLFHFGLVPYASSNGRMNKFATNKISINLLMGYSGSLDGFEIATISNMEQYNMNGAQVAGVANIVGGNAKGVQLAGVSNLTSLKLNGLQIAAFNNKASQGVSGMQVAGAFNVNDGYLNGTQIAAAFNYTNGGVGMQLSGGYNYSSGQNKLVGIQIAGGLNQVRSKLYGMQLSGGMNYVHREGHGLMIAGGFNLNDRKFSGLQVSGGLNKGDIRGAQITAGVNISDELDGVQIGMVNISKKVYGFQIGLVNIANSYELGMPLGFFSWVKGGYKSIGIEYNELGGFQTSFKTGVERFYNIIFISHYPGYTEKLVSGYGLGTLLVFNENMGMNFEAQTASVASKSKNESLNMIINLKSSYYYSFANRFQVFGGLSLNVQLFKDEDARFLSKVGKTFQSLSYKKGKTLNTDIWWGYQFGLRFLF